MARDLHAPRKALGNNVRRLREAKDLTQEELAARVGTRWEWINRIENVKINPTLDNLTKLAQALGVHVTDLLKD